MLHKIMYIFSNLPQAMGFRVPVPMVPAAFVHPTWRRVSNTCKGSVISISTLVIEVFAGNLLKVMKYITPGKMVQETPAKVSK